MKALRRSSSRRRGAALLYVIAAVSATGLLVIANLELATSSRRKANTVEDDTRTEYARLAAAEVFSARAAANSSQAGDPISLTVAGVPVTATVALASGRRATLTVAENGRTGTINAVDPRGYTPFLYALYVDHDAQGSGAFTLYNASSGTPASFYLGNNLAAGKTINVPGAADTKNTYTATDIGSVSGPVKNGVVGPSLAPLPTVLLPSESYVTTTTINGRTSASAGVRFIVSASSLVVSGNFDGNYVLIANNNITIQPPLTVSPGKHLVLMCNGSTSLGGSGSVNAFLYCRSQLNIGGKTVAWTGAIVANDISSSTGFTVTYDDFFWSDPQAVTDYLLPALLAPQ